jgi:hypothetical protein
MKSKDGFVQAYNAQAAVLENQIIVAAEVAPQTTGQLPTPARHGLTKNGAGLLLRVY